MDADAIVVGAGLAGLVATSELADAGRRVLLLDQEGEQSLGGQAFWSLGGLFLVDTPEQRRMGVHDSHDLAWHDWLGSAQFDRPEDHWPGLWARAYVDFAAGEKRSWLRAMGHRIFPVVGLGRARRRSGRRSRQLGAALPHHLGHRAGLVEPFERRVRDAVGARSGRAAASATGSTSWSPRPAPSPACGARCSSRTTSPAAAPAHGLRSAEFELSAQAVIVTSRRHRRQPRPGARNWPARLGSRRSRWSPACPPMSTAGCSASPQAAGARVINPDRMWHYVEGLRNWAPIWAEPRHPDPARAVVAVARRRRAAAARAVLPGFRHPRHPRAPAQYRLRLLLVRAHPVGSSRRSSRCRGRSRTPTSPASDLSLVAGHGCGGACRARSRRSTPTAPTSSSRALRSELAEGMNRVAGTWARSSRRRCAG